MTIAAEAKVHRWTDMESDMPMAGIVRERIIGTDVMISRVRLEAGCLVPMHAHENEQMACIVSGRIRFSLGDDGQTQHTLGAGEVLHIPSNVPHAAEAIEECEILDVFAPPSEGTGIDRS